MVADATGTATGGAAPVAIDLPTPHTIVDDAFEVVRPLGAGGMGAVLLARDLRLGRHVALKFLARPGSDRALQLALREARATARLRHPNIVVLHQVGRWKGQLFLVLELLQGTSLADRLAHGPASVAEAVDWGMQIADALTHAHAEGVIHRDLKPANVFVQDDGRVKVLDFGVAGMDLGQAELIAASGRSAAELAEEHGRTLGGAGSPAYMAPEQWQGRADPRTDLWGLGVTLFEALTAERPFATPRVFQRRPLPADLPADLVHLLDALLAEAPRDRPPDAAAVRAALAPLRQAYTFEATATRHRAASPFRPLAAFAEDDADHFFGRGRIVEAIVERCRTRPALVLTGDAGVGKTSTLRAGVLPAAIRAGMQVTLFESGPRPLARWARALQTTPDALPTALAGARRTIHVIDQLEQATPAGLTALAAALGALPPDLDACVLLAIRADRLATLQPVRLALALGAADEIVLPPLTRAQARSAFEQSLVEREVQFESALVERLLDDVTDGRDQVALPALQVIAAALWHAAQARGARQITRADYDRAGGVEGVLGAAMEQNVERGLPPGPRAAARAVVRALVARRSPLARARIEADIGRYHAPADLRAALDHLVAARLLIPAMVDDAPGLTLAHAALGDRLAAWLDATEGEDRAALDQLRRHLNRRRAGATTRLPVEVCDRLLAHPDRLADLGPGADEARIHLVAVRRAHRLRRALLGGAVAAIVITLATVWWSRAEERRMAAADLGRFSLRVHTPDGDPLDWRLHAPDRGDPRRPGRALVVHRDGEEVEAPGGTRFLQVIRPGCAPSWIRLQGLPGYADRETDVTLDLTVPDCAESHADMIEVPAGDAWVVRAGELTRRPVTGFRLDRTEVTQAAWARFAALGAWTGVDPVRFPPGWSVSPDHPIARVDWYAARDYCRFMGKRLPRSNEWDAAARGLVGPTNPAPQRRFPWGDDPAGGTPNLRGDADGHRRIAPVDAAGDVSPTGVRHLAGNVQEWVADVPDPRAPLRITRGGDWDTPADLGAAETRFGRTRDARYLDYATGLRCAADLVADP